MNIIHFVKYNNTFTIILIIILLGGSSVFANENIRDIVIGETITKVAGVDNTQIVNLDIDNFNLNLTIKNVTEDDKNYYVAYSYTTIGIEDNVWREIIKDGVLNVSKARLGDMDLGIYVSAQLGELADYELNRIKEVNFIEKKKGAQTKVASITYTGLRGLVFNHQEKQLLGYESVKEEKAGNLIGDFTPNLEENNSESEIVKSDSQESMPAVKIQIVKETINREEVRNIVREMLAETSSNITADNIVINMNVETHEITEDQTEQELTVSSEESSDQEIATLTPEQSTATSTEPSTNDSSETSLAPEETAIFTPETTTEETEITELATEPGPEIIEETETEEAATEEVVTEEFSNDSEDSDSGETTTVTSAPDQPTATTTEEN